MELLLKKVVIHETESDFVWLIDPLDGTSNYLHGFPFYSVSIALKIKIALSMELFTTLYAMSALLLRVDVELV